MRAVWKFPIPGIGATFKMSVDAKVVHVAVQDGMPTVWAEVNLDETVPQAARYFAIIGTGHRIPSQMNHVGTWLDGPMVWHLYEERQ